MRHSRELLFVPFLLILLLFAACSDDDSPVATIPTEFQSVQEEKLVAEGTVATFQTLLETNDPGTARQLLVDDLAATEGVASAGVGADGISVWWKTTADAEFVLFTETRASLTDTNQFDKTYRFEPVTATADPAKRFLPHNRKALVLSPYQWDWNLFEIIPIADETGFISTLLSNAGYETTYKVNNLHTEQNVVLSDFAKFDRYGVVALSSHGGVNSSGDVIIATGVQVTDALFRAHMTDIVDGKLILVTYVDKWFTDEDILAFAVTPQWMADFYPGQLDSTLIYASACKSSFNNTMSSILVGSGAGYFGWDHSVGTARATATGKDLFTQLVSNALECGDAFDAVLDNGNGTFTPPLWSSEPDAAFKFTGDVELSLVEAPLRIAATPDYYDDIGALMGGFGYDYTIIGLADLAEPSILADYDVIGINCAGGLAYYAGQAASALEAWVAAGGRLYCSDYAFEFVRQTFPGMINFYTSPYPEIGEYQEVTAVVEDADLRAYLGTDNVEIVYDLSGWVPIESVSAGTDVLLSGVVELWLDPVKSAAGDRHAAKTGRKMMEVDSPLAASFSHGDGVVVYTSFHNEYQISESARHILEYFTILR